MFFSKRVVTAAVAVCLGVVAHGAEEAATASAHVPLLTAKNFDSFVKENPITLVKFMAPWCGHCKKLAPEYEGAAKELKEGDMKVPLAEVDGSAERELAQKYNIEGFPTLFLFRNGKPEPYSGGRTKDTIIEWVKKMTGPAVLWKESKAEAFEAAGEEKVSFVGAFPAKAEAKVFEEVADGSRDKGRFVAYVEAGVKPSVTAVRKDEEQVAAKSLEKADLTHFISEESVPLFAAINGENYAQYAARSSNWVWIAASKDEVEQYAPVIRKVSKNYRTEMNFVALDTDLYKSHAEQALGLSKFPSMAVVYEDVKYHYTSLSEKTTEKDLTKFLQNVKTGKAEKFFKTEPVPATNDDPVKVVVGTTFDDMVMQKDKDVLLKIYAPWCGHCKKMVPIYEELAEKLKGVDHVLVAKIDGTANEVQNKDFKFQGFPTIFFVKAGSKTPEIYEGPRTVDGFMKYLKEKSSKPINVEPATSASSDASNSDEL